MPGKPESCQSRAGGAPPSRYGDQGKARNGSAEDLVDVMSIGFKVVVKPTIGFQASLQGDGTPNQRTAFDISMPWSTLSSVTEMATAASTPMSKVGSPLSSASASAG